jgi:hypothetical protein
MKLEVVYHIPEDGDSPDSPNLCTVEHGGPITPGILTGKFPIPGKFVFRMRHVVNGHVLWQDLPGDQPLQGGRVVLKASRAS